ncbi:MAG: chemotaxis protein CheX [Rhodocyclaceae bacterium]
MTQKLQESDIRAFVDSVCHFFQHSSGEVADVRSAYLAEPSELLQGYDYTGIVDVSGNWRGALYFSAPGAMLDQLLRDAGVSAEPGYEQQLDLIGEIANMFSGRARKALGHELEISVPRRCRGVAIRPSGVSRPYVIPLKWRGHAAQVVVDLQRV